MATSKPAPPIGLPKSSSICKVAIINTTCDIVVPPNTLVEPDIAGHNWLNLPTYAFLITNENTGTQVIFDAGARKDWNNLVPFLADVVDKAVPGVKIKEDLVDILRAGGEDPSKLKAFILSHHHWDHTGNIALLDPKTDLLVGPGFRDAFLPGYPTNKTSEFWEEDFKSRQVIEVPFNDDLKLGNFQAHDYFGDGSLYILNVPGHAIGHISALVRTTPDTAIFLGGDTCHFMGAVRPSEYVPMPEHLPSQTLLDRHLPSPCPCSIFTACHPDQNNSTTSSFYRPSSGPGSWYRDPATSLKSIRSLAEFDADPNILVAIAHDPAPLEIMNFYPNGTINDWKAKGWKEAIHWHFVNELPKEGKTHRDPLVDGQYLNGKKLKGLDGQKV